MHTVGFVTLAWMVTAHNHNGLWLCLWGQAVGQGRVARGFLAVLLGANRPLSASLPFGSKAAESGLAGSLAVAATAAAPDGLFAVCAATTRP